MLAYVPGAGCGMISKPRFYLVGLGGDHRQRLPLPCLSPWPGQGPLTCPDCGQQQGNESLQCQAPGLCRGPRSKNPPPPFPSSSLKTQRGGEEKSLEA